MRFLLKKDILIFSGGGGSTMKSTMPVDSHQQVASTGIALVEETEATGNDIFNPKPLDADNTVSAKPHIPSISASAVLGEGLSMPKESKQCKGYKFDDNDNDQSKDASSSILDSMMNSFLTTGFQATNLALAVEQIRAMRAWRMSDTPWKEGDDDTLKLHSVRQRIRARIFLGYTSNQISCGQREVLRFLVKNKMVDVIVTTAGGIEEDIIKCFQPTYMGDFKYSGKELRRKGINRIGNLLVPNKNYCEFEDWFSPLIVKMHDEQDAASIEWAKQMAAIDFTSADMESEPLPAQFVWSPSEVIRRLGKEINHEDSVLYWAAMNDIPVFCPALTDGSIGDMLFFHSYKRPGFILDINSDIRRINDLAVRSHCTGQIIIGGGVVKHHTCNANLMRNGADYSVFINTAQEFDGSDSGASPDEAISWGKIRINAKPVKVACDATIAFPLIVSQTFAKDVAEWKTSTEGTVCWAEDLTV